jgi:hypothetical protein
MGLWSTQGNEERLGPETTLYRTVALSFVIPRACDFFDLFVFSAYPTSCISSPRQSRHPERSASQIYRNRGLYGAESKDPGDACRQMLLGAFRPQTAPEDKKSQTPSGAEG